MGNMGQDPDFNGTKVCFFETPNDNHENHVDDIGLFSNPRRHGSISY